MQACDAFDHLRHLDAGQRRPAPGPVPGEQQLERYLRVDAVPEQMSGQRRDGVIATSLVDAVAHQRAPLGGGVTGA